MSVSIVNHYDAPHLKRRANKATERYPSSRPLSGGHVLRYEPEGVTAEPNSVFAPDQSKTGGGKNGLS
jgi:hypothetical protein